MSSIYLPRAVRLAYGLFIPVVLSSHRNILPESATPPGSAVRPGGDGRLQCGQVLHPPGRGGGGVL